MLCPFFRSLAMPYDPAVHHRRSIRPRGYDYAQNGAYFVTVCTHAHACLFGAVENGAVSLSALGAVIERLWEKLAVPAAGVFLDEFVVMPNHFHGIIVIGRTASPSKVADPRVAAVRSAALSGTVPGSFPAIVQTFKSVSTRRAHGMGLNAALLLWQRNYYEHVIRDEPELTRIRHYIVENPMRWELDRYHPARLGGQSVR